MPQTNRSSLQSPGPTSPLSPVALVTGLTLHAALSWRVLVESAYGIHVELRFHADDDSVRVATVHVGADDQVTVTSKARPSRWDLAELVADLGRYASRSGALYLEAA